MTTPLCNDTLYVNVGTSNPHPETELLLYTSREGVAKEASEYLLRLLYDVRDEEFFFRLCIHHRTYPIAYHELTPIFRQYLG